MQQRQRLRAARSIGKSAGLNVASHHPRNGLAVEAQRECDAMVPDAETVHADISGQMGTGCSPGNSETREPGLWCRSSQVQWLHPRKPMENTMKETKAGENCALTDAELAGAVGGELSEAIRFFIAALASPAPYNPKEPNYSGFG